MKLCLLFTVVSPNRKNEPANIHVGIAYRKSFCTRNYALYCIFMDRTDKNTNSYVNPKLVCQFKYSTFLSFHLVLWNVFQCYSASRIIHMHQAIHLNIYCLYLHGEIIQSTIVCIKNVCTLQMIKG